MLLLDIYNNLHAAEGFFTPQTPGARLLALRRQDDDTGKLSLPFKRTGSFPIHYSLLM